MSDGHQEIAKRLASQTADIVLNYLPEVIESIQKTEHKISFGVKFTFEPKAGVIICTLKPTAPKIPCEEMDEQSFVLEVTPAMQLAFVFAGTEDEFAIFSANESGGNSDEQGTETAAGGPPTGAMPGDDDYSPGDNSLVGDNE